MGFKWKKIAKLVPAIAVAAVAGPAAGLVVAGASAVHDQQRREERQERQRQEEQDRVNAEAAQAVARAIDQAKQLEAALAAEEAIRQERSIEDIRREQIQNIQAVLSQVAADPVIAARYVNAFKAAFLGKTSVGKSSLINWLLPEANAPTGRGETTLKVAAYPAPHGLFCLMDFPGLNDLETYDNTPMASAIFAMDVVFILYESTYRECSNLVDILEAKGNPYYVVLSKADAWTVPALQLEQQSTRTALASKRHCKGLLSVSAKTPTDDNETLKKVIAKIV